ncbi:MAG TPA: saccharopine dehydrogenase [Candidatus Aciduliprofundum boonei]|uniref:Saccharopine dehydrogenase n=1 Tax=Candidatus Aciduliprofundum boonei TaxID=379547 RepID=A0A7J3T8E0_9ARCH|nr:saccharopine dehydrogenase [Candidatus Aciduliprofundum boonei]
MKIIVLGGGLVGGVIARDIAKDFDVTVADGNPKRVEALKKEGLGGIVADLSKPENIKEVVKDYDIVIGALPGFLGYTMLKSVVEAGKNIVDISFTPENVLQLDSLAKRERVTAVVDMGVAPGISNLIVGYVDSILDKTENVLIMVGGLPVKREWPYEYKLVFSPYDLLDEYLRPARLVECGKPVVKPALSDVELVNLPEVGTLEAFNTDGLRSLLYTVKAYNMKEKTLRYPGHAEKMRILRESGFLRKDFVEVNGVKIRPIDLTAKLLFPLLELKEGEMEFTVMRVIVEGEKEGKKMRYTYDLLDYYDREKKETSMARTTGYPCAIVARIVARGDYQNPGVNPPEYLGKNHKIFHEILDELRKRNVIIKENVGVIEK